jgi:hypothetical protein
MNADGPDGSRASILRAGATRLVIAAMNTHTADVRVLENACRALWHLASGDGNPLYSIATVCICGIAPSKRWHMC